MPETNTCQIRVKEAERITIPSQLNHAVREGIPLTALLGKPLPAGPGLH